MRIRAMIPDGILWIRGVLAAKAAGSAVVAWALVEVVPLLSTDYPYYAPLGALLATNTTVAGSIRETGQAVAAITVGAAVGVGSAVMLGPTGWSVAVAVGGSFAFVGWRRLGAASMWVPTTAVFVLIVGRGDPLEYIGSYAGLTLFGAVIGIGVNLMLPPLPLATFDYKAELLRQRLATQLDDLVEGLQIESAPSAEQWDERRHRLTTLVADVRSAAERTTEARLGNHRARKHREAARLQYERARGLERLAFLIEEVTQLITERELYEQHRVPLGPMLRPPVRDVIAALAEVLRSPYETDPHANRERVARASRALRRLATAYEDCPADSLSNQLYAGSIIISIRRILELLSPLTDRLRVAGSATYPYRRREGTSPGHSTGR